MKFLKYVPHPGIIGVLAFLMMVIEPMITPFLISWVAFQTWAMYFLAGGTVSRGVKTAACYLAGMVAAALIIIISGWLTPSLGAMALPLTVGVIAFLVIFFEKVPALDFIPAWFVGAGAYFAFMTIHQFQMPHPQAHLYVFSSALIGLLWGFFTVFLRTRYQAWLDHQKPGALQATPAK